MLWPGYIQGSLEAGATQTMLGQRDKAIANCRGQKVKVIVSFSVIPFEVELEWGRFLASSNQLFELYLLVHPSSKMMSFFAKSRSRMEL